MSLDI
jgi:hypothetical protein